MFESLCLLYGGQQRGKHRFSAAVCIRQNPGRNEPDAKRLSLYPGVNLISYGKGIEMNKKNYELLNRPSLVLWCENTIVFVRWSGGIDIKQGDNTVFIEEEEADNFITALKESLKLSCE